MTNRVLIASTLFSTMLLTTTTHGRELAKDTLGGAAKGAAIGAIAGDAGKGAAAGAVDVVFARVREPYRCGWRRLRRRCGGGSRRRPGA